jgi:hypothetical protein
MDFPIPDDPDALLTREHTAGALANAGYPIKPKTLATKASRGGGPPYRRFGSRALYRWGDALDWAKARLTPLITSTSEEDRLTPPIPSASEEDQRDYRLDREPISERSTVTRRAKTHNLDPPFDDCE